MNNTSTTRLGGATLLLLLLVAGCGGPPGDNPMLQEAQTAYQTASNDSLILARAPVELEEAEESLMRSRQIHQEGDDEALATHHAYLAKQRVAIARETAKRNAADASIRQFESERKEVVAEARAREAERARAEAEASRAEAEEQRRAAEQARAEAEEALRRAEELSEQLEAERTERGLVLTLGDVLFDLGQATLKPGGERAVGELTSFLNEYPERTVLIEGFTDSTGPEAFNEELSQRRADAVREAIVAGGIAGTRIQTRGYGEQYPVASNNTDAGRQQNRRVEVIISDKSGTIPERTE